MKTEYFINNPEDAAELILSGELVAVPTETVYGLAGNGLDAEAVEKIYEVKGRPAIKPLSLMVHDADDMEKYCVDVPENAKFLAEKYWPGPLTIVMKAKDIVPEIVRAGGSTVGLRCPLNEKTLSLIKKCGVPFAAPSANPSGEPSPKSAEEVGRYFDGKIGGIIDDGRCELGLESTLIDMSSVPYRILREAAVKESEIREVLASGIMVFGLTGPSGAGKTTALDALKELGALILDCDEIYHSLLNSSEELKDEIRSFFPEALEDNAVNTKTLGKIVYGKNDLLNILNQITHKYVLSEIEEKLKAFAFRGGKTAVIDAPLLIESGFNKKCDFVIGVLSDRETRLERIMARDGISVSYAEQRLDSQPKDEYYIKHCDKIIYNNGEVAVFKEQVKSIYTEVLNGRNKRQSVL